MTKVSEEQAKVNTILKALDNLALDYGENSDAALAVRALRAEIKLQQAAKLEHVNAD